MIHADNTKIEIKGSEVAIKTQLTFILKGLIEHGVIKNDDDMSNIYNLAKIPSEEVKKEACNKLDSMDIGEALAVLMFASGRFDDE